MFFVLAGLFIAGLVQDWLNSEYIGAVAERRRLKAAIFAGLTTVLSYTVFAAIMQHMGSISLVVAFSLGNALGTWASVAPRSSPSTAPST